VDIVSIFLIIINLAIFYTAFNVTADKPNAFCCMLIDAM